MIAKSKTTLLWQLGTLAALLAIWQWAAVTRPVPYLPTLEAISSAYLQLLQGNLLTTAVLPSLYRFALGFGFAAFAGTVIGLTLGYFRSLDPWIRPMLEYLRFIPAVAILPAALLLFGATDFMRIFVIAFGAVFPVILAAIDGARRVDRVLIDVARVNGLSPTEQLTRVILPAALPSVFAGIRIALSIGLVMMVISELIAADDGLGFFILRSQRLFQTASVYAGVLLLGTIGLALTLALLTLERRLLSWHLGWRGVADEQVGSR